MITLDEVQMSIDNFEKLRIYLLGIVKKESNVEFYDQVITLPEAEERFEMMQFPRNSEALKICLSCLSTPVQQQYGLKIC
ncbi:hypothetical protein RIR_jg32601.t1 [Rhizophagus irregularis DAOM 181602=DAOM 197198]|nr:hypothetical protein RIR_jg32601.t1 [Rhizophagus irregularis DAOM 181602=DAOM 197198]